jgi:hypothetical protein
MKFTVSTVELKNVLDLVKTVADQSEGSKVAAHSVCLFRAFPQQNILKMDFALNGSFLTYEFSGAVLDGDQSGELRRSIDMSVLTGLRFTGKEVSIDIQSKKGENTLSFSSGSLKGKLLVASSEIEEQVEEARPKEDAVDVNYTFVIKDWIKALNAHLYGVHHNAVEAERRSVRIRSKGESLYFNSQDKVASGQIVLKAKHPINHELDISLTPRPLKSILNSLSKESTGDFHFGVSKDYWRICHGRTDIWFPRLVQDQKADTDKLDKLVAEIQEKPSYNLQLPCSIIKDSINELSSLLSSTSSKDDMPTATLQVQSNSAMFSVNTSKAKDVRRELDGIEIMGDRLTFDTAQEICINFKFLQEFVSSLISCAEQPDPAIRLKWWPYQGENSPTKGRTIHVSCENNFYVVARVRV